MKVPLPKKKEMIKLKKKTLERRINKFHKAGSLHSTVLRFGMKGRGEQFKFKKYLASTVKGILEGCLEDVLRSPMNNPAKSGLLSIHASHNIYFGLNHSSTENKNVLTRTAYGLGSAKQSNGYDMRKHKIHYMFPDMQRLLEIVAKRTKEHYAKLGLPGVDCSFNSCTVKVYVDKQETGWHTDMHYLSGHEKPVANNSQKPGTPTAIAVFGDPKWLHMHQYELGEDGKQCLVEPLVAADFYQQHGMLMILDPRDEELHHGRFWRHGAQLENDSGVSLSCMFRVVQKTVDVRVSNGQLHKVRNIGKKDAAFDKGQKKLNKNRVEYEGEIRDRMNLIKSVLTKR